MTEQEALDALESAYGEWYDSDADDTLAAIVAFFAAYFRDHPDVARALGIGSAS